MCFSKCFFVYGEEEMITQTSSLSREMHELRERDGKKALRNVRVTEKFHKGGFAWKKEVTVFAWKTFFTAVAE